jgi:hypothetical protein
VDVTWTAPQPDAPPLTIESAGDPVRPWWKTDSAGQVVVSIKFGARPIEFEKGNAGIVVPSKDKLPVVIDT